MTSELVFAPGILKVVTNQPDLRGFVFGRPPLWQTDAAGHDTRVTLEYTVTDHPAGPSGNGSREVVGSRRILGSVRATSVLDLAAGRLALKVNPAYVAWSSLRFTASHPRPEHILNNLAVVGLLTHGLTPLHGAAVSRGDQATVLFAPSNTGKTYSTWRLVSELGLDLLGDDILATDGHEIIGFPFTATGVPPGVSAPAAPAADRLRKLVMIHPNKPRLMDALPPERVRARARVQRIVFLRRGKPGVRRVDAVQAAEWILPLNRLEFRHLGAKYLAQSWWQNGVPDLQELAVREASLIRRMADSAAEILEITSDDPAAFAPRIAEHIAERVG
jgi:hypothetical protein